MNERAGHGQKAGGEDQPGGVAGREAGEGRDLCPRVDPRPVRRWGRWRGSPFALAHKAKLALYDPIG